MSGLPGMNPDGSFIDAQQTWADIKPEMYAISAVLADDVVSLALEKNLVTSAEQLAEHINKVNEFGIVDVFSNLQAYTTGTLTQTIEEIRQNIDPVLRGKVWERYDVLDKFLITHVREPDPSNKKDTILARGLQTGSVVMSNVMKIIPLVYKYAIPGSELTSAQLTTIAANSYQVFADLARRHISDFTNENNWLQEGLDDNFDDSFNPDKFLLEQTENGLALQIRDHESNGTIDNDEPLIGCPARLNLGEGSGIQRLWDWHVQHAPALYDLYIQQLSVEPNWDLVNFDVSVESLRELLERIVQ